MQGIKVYFIVFIVYLNVLLYFLINLPVCRSLTLNCNYFFMVIIRLDINYKLHTKKTAAIF